MGLVINSANIQTFEILTTYNLHDRTITLHNQTSYQGGGAAATQGIDFALTSPSGLVYYENTDYGADADITPSAPTTDFTYSIPTFNNFVEIGIWTMSATIKEGNGDTWTLTYRQNICKPPQCSTQASLYDGCAVIEFTANCQTNKTIYSDGTVYTYQNVAASSVSYDVEMAYPLSSGLSPVTYTSSFFSTSPIYSGLYQFNVANVATYYFSASNTNIVITYSSIQEFKANCLQSLCGIECAFKEFMAKFLENQGNGTANSKLSKYSVNNAIKLLGLMADAQLRYQCAEDLTAVIEEIEALTGATCDCSCSANVTQPISTDQEIIINAGCGDITVDQTTAGLTTTYTINDVSYVVESSSSGVTVTETTDSGTCTKTYSVDVCLEDLALCGSVFPIEDGNGSTVNMGSGSTYEQIVSAQNSATTVIEGRLDALEAAPTWTNIANGDMSNSWANLVQVAYTRSVNGEVSLRGEITNTSPSASTICFQLPNGYRPPQSCNFGSALWDVGGGAIVACFILINTNGNVTILYDGGAIGTVRVGLDGINFNVNA